MIRTIVNLSLVGAAIVGMTELQGQTNTVLPESDTDWIVFVGEATDAMGNPASALYRIRPHGDSLERITEAGRYRTVSISPLGRRLAYFHHVSVYTSDWQGKNPVNLRPLAREHFQPRWSPDGQRIAFTSDATDDAEVWIMNADGGNARNLTWSATSADMSPAWSPDGSAIVFVSNRRGPYELFVLTLATGELRNLAPGIGNCREPAWSPDGQWIAFSIQHPGGADLVRIPATGGEPERLTEEGTEWNGQPAFDADGNRLCFVSNRDGMTALMVMDLPTRRLHKITADTPCNPAFPTWVPRQLGPALDIPEAQVADRLLPRPRLLFTTDELPALRERLARPELAPAWTAFLARCDALADPASEPGRRLRDSVAEIPAKVAWNSPWIDGLFSLAFAYQASGEQKYADVAAPLFVQACDALARYHVQPVLDLWKYAPGKAACTLDWLSPLLADDHARAIRTLFANSCRAAYAGIVKSPFGLGPGHDLRGGTSNYSVFMADALGSPALALHGTPEYDPNWLAASVHLLELTANRWFDEQGACHESASYFKWPMDAAMIFMTAVDRLGFSDCLRTGNVRRWPYWYAVTSANGLATLVATGDTYNSPPPVPLGFASLYDSDPLVPLLCQRAGLYSKPDPTVESLLWWRPTADDPQALDGLPRLDIFTGPGYGVLRDGYETNDPFMLLAASDGRGHSHAESGAVQLYAYGASLLIDTGYGDALPTSHSQVLINGMGRPYPASPVPVNAFAESVTGKFASAIKLDCTAMFGERAESHLDYTIPLPGLPMRRYIRYAAMIHGDGKLPPYCLLYDDVDANGTENRYASQFLAEAGRQFDVSGSRAVLIPAANSDADPVRLLVAFLDGAPINLETGQHQMRKVHHNRELLHFPRLRAQREAINPHFLTLLYPYREGMPMPQIEVSADSAAREARIIWPDAVDTIIAAAPDRLQGNPGLTTDARLAVVRQRGDGTVSWLLVDGSRLHLDDLPVVTLAKPGSAISE